MSFCYGEEFAQVFRRYGAQAVVATVTDEALARRVAQHLGNGEPLPVALLHPCAPGHAHQFDDERIVGGKYVLGVANLLTTSDAERVIVSTRAANAHLLAIGAVFSPGIADDTSRKISRIVTLSHGVDYGVTEEQSCALCAK